MATLIKARWVLLWLAFAGTIAMLAMTLAPALLPGLSSWMLYTATPAVGLMLPAVGVLQGLGALAMYAHLRGRGAGVAVGVALAGAIAWALCFASLGLGVAAGPGGAVIAFLVSFPLALIAFGLQIAGLVMLRGAERRLAA